MKMSHLKFIAGIIAILLMNTSFAQQFSYNDSWGKNGFSLTSENRSGVEVNYSITNFSLDKQDINGELLDNIQLLGSLLPHNEGAPNVPGKGHYIAIPEGAHATFEIVEMRTETFNNIDLAPAPEIPLITDEPPLKYERDMSIYNTDAFYPVSPVIVSNPDEVRGVDFVNIGVIPFQYNPVTKELIVIRDLKIKIDFIGGNGYFGEDRLRSRFWDPMLKDMFLNNASLPEVEYLTKTDTRNQDYEYVIITPDNPTFMFWADSLRKWRNAQGINTGVFSLTEIGGNNSGAIENFINNAYYNWNIAPSAVLLMADYGTTGDNTIISPFWNSYCVSDNIYADVTGNDLPDVSLARITGQNGDQLETMLSKMFNYELSPPENSDFYDNPISAGGWQSDRWFILCSDILFGFWENELNKSPVREYAGYSGGAPSYWSTNSNTSQVVNYFGPSGLGYIPSTPSHLTDWGGNATRINNDLNAGAFMIVHRDHGVEMGWDSPYYHSSNISGLDENDLSFVFSINCLTGKYNISSACFAETFHRDDYGALGIIAASETSYSFVNDVYTWGMWDEMWPDFDPNYGTGPSNSDWIRPCFANSYGKHYLSASNWPSNPQNKPHTYHLFHHHGDAFMYVYSEVPQNLSVSHDDVVVPGASSFSVTASSGALVGLSINGEYIDSGISTGGPVILSIPDDLSAGNILKIVVTKQNYYRYDGFATVAGIPGNASQPEPTNHEIGSDPFTDLQWAKGAGGIPESYKVYLGTDNPPTNITNGENVYETTFNPSSDLDFETQYFWRIESYNTYGNSEGDIWDFTISSTPDEDFESGNFNENSWYFGGDTDWVIDNNTTRHGNYSAKSGDIIDGQSSSLFIDLYAESSFSVPIVFWTKTSTVESVNSLQLYIDGNMVGEWSGENDWSKETFFVLTGDHTFEWRYNKTATAGSDDDCVWVDYIIFPPDGNTMTASAGPDGITCEDNDYQLNGSAENYAFVEWVTSGDGFFDNPEILAPVYSAGLNDIETGSVTLTLTAYKETDESVSDNMTLSIQQSPEAYAGEAAEICNGYNYNISDATVEYCELFEWTTAGDGTFSDNTIIDPVYYPGTGDIANGGVNLTLTATGYSPCGLTDDMLSITIIDVPEVPGTPTGPDHVDVFYTSTSSYTTSGSITANSYSWMIDPAEAGSITGNETTGLVEWDTDYLGTAIVSVAGVNDCGEGVFSEGFSVSVYNTVGLNKVTNNISVDVVPNPNNGDFAIKIRTDKQQKLNIKLVNAVGSVVYKEEIEINKSFVQDLHLNKLNEGVYFLLIRGNNLNTVQKVIIQK